MIRRAELTHFLDEYLDIKAFDDSCWNGLQVEGKEEVERVITAVTVGQELFERAAAVKADFAVVHHGHFWQTDNPAITGWKKDRLRPLLQNNISLYAAHLPLDRHQEVGNNARLLELIEAEVKGEFYKPNGLNISWWGQIPRGRHLSEIEQVLQTELHATCITLPFGPAIVQTVAVCTGAGGYSAIHEALELGVDLYITGDTVEIYHIAKDAGLNVIFAGHHATETLGVQALGEKIAHEFSIPVEFIDIPTEL